MIEATAHDIYVDIIDGKLATSIIKETVVDEDWSNAQEYIGWIDRELASRQGYKHISGHSSKLWFYKQNRVGYLLFRIMYNDSEVLYFAHRIKKIDKETHIAFLTSKHKALNELAIFLEKQKRVV